MWFSCFVGVLLQRYASVGCGLACSDVLNGGGDVVEEAVRRLWRWSQKVGNVEDEPVKVVPRRRSRWRREGDMEEESVEEKPVEEEPGREPVTCRRSRSDVVILLRMGGRPSEVRFCLLWCCVVRRDLRWWPPRRSCGLGGGGAKRLETWRMSQ